MQGGGVGLRSSFRVKIGPFPAPNRQLPVPDGASSWGGHTFPTSGGENLQEKCVKSGVDFFLLVDGKFCYISGSCATCPWRRFWPGGRNLCGRISTRINDKCLIQVF